MDPDVLHEGYQQILSHIYAPRAYYERVRTFLREYQGASTRTAPFALTRSRPLSAPSW